MLSDPLRWLVIPIETKVREFDAKLLLACAAAEAGYGVILGHQHAILRNWRRMPRAVVFDKSVVKANLKKFSAYREKGNFVAAWCEEGLLLADEQDYLNRKIFAPTLEHVNLFCVWGENQSEVVLKKVPEVQSKMEQVGNPRIDLLRAELRNHFARQAENLRGKYGPFLLINTNFAPYNNIRGMETSLQIQKQSGKISSSEGEQLFLDFVRFKKEMYHAFISMASCLAESCPDRTVIIRPHPAENHDNWQAIANHYQNMKVIHSGNVINWILAAEATIQNGCTTGIESFLLDRPTISYQPFESTVYANYLPDILGVKVATEESLVEYVKSIADGERLQNEEDMRKKREYARRFIANVDGPLCIDRIVSLLATLPLEYHTLVPPLPERLLRNASNLPTTLKYLLRDVKDHFISGETLSFRKGSQESLASVQKKIRMQVFPGLDRSEVSAGITSFQDVTKRFAGLQVVPICENCVAIGPGG
jgi:surface carbohydrate biosynthesis protein